MATQKTTERRPTRAARERNERRRPSRTRRLEKPPVTWGIPWGSQNLIGIGVGIGVIIIGYLLMGTAIADEPMTDKSIWNNATATTIAPILLTLAYCVIIPVAIFWRRKEDKVIESGHEE